MMRKQLIVFCLFLCPLASGFASAQSELSPRRETNASGSTKASTRNPAAISPSNSRAVTDPVTGIPKTPGPAVVLPKDSSQPASNALPEIDPEKASDTVKSKEQRLYEAEKNAELVTLSEHLQVLKNRIEVLSAEKQLRAKKLFEIAEGQRTKLRRALKQLRFAAPSQWKILRPAVDASFVDLEKSIDDLRSFIERP
jgi:hypothetical protein